jgi:integrase
MVSLRQDERGNFIARKKLPEDVRQEYGRLYGQHHEAKFFRPASTPKHKAKRDFNDWEQEVDNRIAAIRAARDGTGLTLTRAQARELAGQWYEWWTVRRPNPDLRQVEHWRDAVQEALYLTISEAEEDAFGRDELWRDREDVRESVRPVLADIGETAQFLAGKGVALTNASRDLFLDFLYDDVDAALKRLERLAQGDYRPDTYTERFPKRVAGTDTGIAVRQLFELWVDARKPAYGTVENWRYMLGKLHDHFPERSAASIQPEDAEAWLTGLVSPDLSAATVKNTWLKAVNTVFRWGVRKKHVPRNPFEHAAHALTVIKRERLRETNAFLPEEWTTILTAAEAVKDTRKPDNAAKHWVPWLCAYTGARPGEITQLRGSDVIERGGIHGIKITPAAGTVKGKTARVVPLHEHIIAQGFLIFVEARGSGPLFYKPRSSEERGPLDQKKPPAAQVRQRLADWVRKLGVSDPEISPNHGWRHTFKQIADRHRMSERMSDYITGHARKSTGARYGEPLFPRYTWTRKKSNLKAAQARMNTAGRPRGAAAR